MPKRRFKPFDTSAFLDDDEVIAEYLTAALEDRDPDVFLTAISQVAKARGIASIAAPQPPSAHQVVDCISAWSSARSCEKCSSSMCRHSCTARASPTPEDNSATA